MPERPFAISSGLSFSRACKKAIGTGGSPTTTGCFQLCPLRQSMVQNKVFRSTRPPKQNVFRKEWKKFKIAICDFSYGSSI